MSDPQRCRACVRSRGSPSSLPIWGWPPRRRPSAHSISRGGDTLSIAAPVATVSRDDVSAAIGAGSRAVLAEFRSAPVTERVEAATATAILYLVTAANWAWRTAPSSRPSCPGAPRSTSARWWGPDRCPRPSCHRRRPTSRSSSPFPLTGPVALPADQIALSVGVENRCSEARTLALRYDALGWVSALRLDGVPASETPTTTTTTTPATTTTPTTSTTGIPTEPPTTTTTTTLPYPFGCLFQPLEGYEAVFCRLDTLGEVLLEEGPTSFGGAARYDRVQRRLEQARGRVILAQSGKRPAAPAASGEAAARGAWAPGPAWRAPGPDRFRSGRGADLTGRRRDRADRLPAAALGRPATRVPRAGSIARWSGGPVYARPCSTTRLVAVPVAPLT